MESIHPPFFIAFYIYPDHVISCKPKQMSPIIWIHNKQIIKLTQMHIIFFILALCFAPIVSAASYTIGDKIENLSLPDQFEKTASIDQQTQLVLFNQDKEAGNLIEEALAEVPQGYLAEQQITYVSDISGMPGFISSFIAIPAMQQRNYPILLDREGNHTQQFPRQKGKATLIYLDALLIKKIIHLDSIEKIQQALGLNDSK
jgi:hypothetical protein